MMKDFNRYGNKFEAMVDNYLKFDVTIYPLVLKIYLNAQQFTTDQVDMSTNVRHTQSFPDQSGRISLSKHERKNDPQVLHTV